MMAESVNDVATVQRTLQRTLEATEDELVAQARLTRDLQDDLLRTRMVEFEGLSDRLYRVVRQAAKETGKQVRLDIVGGSIELDRGVLDRMTGAFEHLLRNCVAHGIETPDGAQGGRQGRRPGRSSSRSRTKATKSASSSATTAPASTSRASAPRARRWACSRRAAEHSDAELANLIFTPGFSTADTVTELAGRGVGMDVVRAEVDRDGRPHRDRDRRRPGHVVQAGPAADDRGDAGGDAALRRDARSRCRRRWSRSCAARRRPRSTPPTRAAPTRSATRRCRSSGSARCCSSARAPGDGAGPDAHRRRRAQRPAAHRASTSTKCSATRKWSSRTSARSCRACPASPA